RRADVALSGAESEAWARVRGGSEFADASADCPYRIGGYCFVERAAQRARAATIVVTTHAALARHLTRRETLPDASCVIVLDGRQIEDELRRQQTFTLDAAAVLALLDALAMTSQPGDMRGGLLPLAASLAPETEPQRVSDWYRAVERAHEATFTLFGALRGVMQESQERNTRGASRRGDLFDNGSLRIDNAVRSSRAWELLLRAWARFSDDLGAVADAAREAAQSLASTGDTGDALASRASGARADLLGLAWRIGELTVRGSEMFVGQRIENTVCWLRAPQTQQFQQGDAPRERRPAVRNGDAAGATRATEDGAGDETGEPELPAEERDEHEQRDARDSLIAEAPTFYGAPTQVGAQLAPLWAEGRGMAALGWALSVGGDFEYTRSALGLPETTRAIAATPDYSGQTLLCLPTDAPEPAAQSYHAQFETLIVALARALEGDVVAIFPSHAALRTAAMGIRRTLERYDILALAQGIDGSARQLWQSFYGQPRTVLLGAGTFWDGAQQRNRPPACIVVARTPFPPQSDPLVAARADLWADQQAQFMTPQAALKLRQAPIRKLIDAFAAAVGP
ncbi:MAG TPA: helicase C-terminal domain-containing protein, partial [Ktedonobacterales bacterium]